MTFSNALVLAAHPGHELLLHDWLSTTRPAVCVLTDGSGHAGVSRLDFTRRLLAATGATEGPVFGRFTDREMYEVIRGGRGEVLQGVTAELAHYIETHSIEWIVVDAMEGFNPVHDLCRIIGGAAADAIPSVQLYEYPIHDRPESYSDSPGAVISRLDDAAVAAKMHAAHVMAPVIPDILDVLAEAGQETFRVESMRPVADWRTAGWPAGERPLYERFGEQRVADGRYDSVIRYGEHFLPLLNALRSTSLCVLMTAQVEALRASFYC